MRKRLGQVGLQQSENYELHRVMKRVEALYDELTVIDNLRINRRK